jgi:type IV secretory pathway protease TraF
VVLLEVGGETCVKRIVGLGGDRFWTFGPTTSDHRGLLVGGANLRRWKRRYPRLVYRRIQVPPGTVYVLGDDPTSLDSRKYGPVPVSRIEGRVLFPAVSDAQAEPTPCVWTSLPQLPNRPSHS